MARKINFFAGPSVLPLEVLETLGKEMVDFQGTGLSLVESSHRAPAYDAVHQSALEGLRKLLDIPENFKILFVGGGATMQFAMIPLNFLPKGKSCDFTLTGAWAGKAYNDAKKLGQVNVVFDGKESSFSTLPDPAAVKVTPGAAYMHITSNETIGGLQWKDFPDTGDVPLIADMSSDILSRPLPWKKFGMVYAGAQKNLAPSGLAVLIIREDLLEGCPADLPAYLNYQTHAKANSLYNTPPVFPIWAMDEVLKRWNKLGGMDYIVAHNRKKADALYAAIEADKDFYSCPVDPAYRSDMNVVFTLPTAELDAQFVAEAKEKGMVGLKGHRSVGGCRASIYNGMTLEGVETLTAFMADFARKNS